MKKLFVILVLVSEIILAQNDPFADSVIYYNWGTGDFANQNPPYFPGNVLGEPSRNATETVPENDPYEICSLGFGGEIIIAFTDNAIVNGEGVDFTVFENAFRIRYGARAGEIFAEPAKVAASKDGITFYEFPFDSLTLEGLAGKTPTNGAADPTNPDSSGGDSFDLSDIGLDTVYFMKITDVTEIIREPSHPFFDPTANGFDLDAVVAVHSAFPVNAVYETSGTKNAIFISRPYPNPAGKSRNGKVHVNVRAEKVVVSLYDILGRRIFSTGEIFAPHGAEVSFPVGELAEGIYFIRAYGKSFSIHKKIAVVR